MNPIKWQRKLGTTWDGVQACWPKSGDKCWKRLQNLIMTEIWKKLRGFGFAVWWHKISVNRLERRKELQCIQPWPHNNRSGIWFGHSCTLLLNLIVKNHMMVLSPLDRMNFLPSVGSKVILNPWEKKKKKSLDRFKKMKGNNEINPDINA